MSRYITTEYEAECAALEKPKHRRVVTVEGPLGWTSAQPCTIIRCWYSFPTDQVLVLIEEPDDDAS